MKNPLLWTWSGPIRAIPLHLGSGPVSEHHCEVSAVDASITIDVSIDLSTTPVAEDDREVLAIDGSVSVDVCGSCRFRELEVEMDVASHMLAVAHVGTATDETKTFDHLVASGPELELLELAAIHDASGLRAVQGPQVSILRLEGDGGEHVVVPEAVPGDPERSGTVDFELHGKDHLSVAVHRAAPAQDTAGGIPSDVQRERIRASDVHIQAHVRVDGGTRMASTRGEGERKLVDGGDGVGIGVRDHLPVGVRSDLDRTDTGTAGDLGKNRLVCGRREGAERCKEGGRKDHRGVVVHRLRAPWFEVWFAVSVPVRVGTGS